MKMGNAYISVKTNVLLCIVCYIVFIDAQPQNYESRLQEESIASSDLNALKAALRTAYNRELEYYERQEAIIMKQIEDLESDKHIIQAKKRNHIQCLVNVIACYRRK